MSDSTKALSEAISIPEPPRVARMADAEAPEFSVCCLVTQHTDYTNLRLALDEQGFNQSNCEFLVCDNSQGNKFTAYEAIRAFLAEAKGKYVLIVHQDAIPLETAGQLLARIAEVEEADPLWGVIGNAGRTMDATPVIALQIDGMIQRPEKPFARVATVDENMILVRNACRLTVSADIDGFHFYAFDLCSVAARLGYRCYVVDHLWRHDSRGTVDEVFFAAKERMEAKMRAYTQESLIPTTCTALCWSRALPKVARAKALSLRLIGHPVHSKAWWRLWWGTLVTNPLFLGYFFYLLGLDALGWVVRQSRRRSGDRGQGTHTADGLRRERVERGSAIQRTGDAAKPR